MDLEKLPVWSAYIVAPLLVLAFGFQTIAQSENPIFLAVMAMVCGVFCAAALHGYIWIKGRISRK